MLEGMCACLMGDVGMLGLMRKKNTHQLPEFWHGGRGELVFTMVWDCCRYAWVSTLGDVRSSGREERMCTIEACNCADPHSTTRRISIWPAMVVVPAIAHFLSQEVGLVHPLLGPDGLQMLPQLGLQVPLGCHCHHVGSSGRPLLALIPCPEVLCACCLQAKSGLGRVRCLHMLLSSLEHASHCPGHSVPACAAHQPRPLHPSMPALCPQALHGQDEVDACIITVVMM